MRYNISLSEEISDGEKVRPCAGDARERERERGEGEQQIF